ncbi:MAG: hypothetical protein J7L54_03070, partial [Elusimicrobia bacterium]|nr:hypothetical protein [Elusimicrobiota bacterium]
MTKKMISPANKIFFIGPRSQLNQFLSFLQHRGVVEISDVSEDLKLEKGAVESSYFALLKKISQLKEVVEFLGEGKIPQLKGAAGREGFNADEIISKSMALKTRISEILSEEKNLESEIKKLEFILSLGVDFEKLFSVKKLKWKIVFSSGKNSLRLENILAQGDFIHFEKITQKGRRSFYIVFFRGELPSVEKYATVVDISGNPASRLKAAKKRFEELEEEKKLCSEDKVYLAGFLPQILFYYDYCENLKLREKFKQESIAATKKAFFLSGW